MVFVHRAKVLFRHCDPNRIVFYPRYLEIANDAVEAWFEARLGVPFETLHGDRALGVPTVRLEIEFGAPSVHGDMLAISIAPRRLGRASLDIAISAACGDERRFSMTSTLVCAAAGGGRATPWPDDLRGRIEGEMRQV